MHSELTFRAQLVIYEQRYIYDYWCREAARKIMPSEQAFQVDKIADVTPYLSLVKTDPQFHSFHYKSSGTQVNKIYGCNLSSMRFDQLKWGQHLPYWKVVYSKIMQEKIPLQGVTKGSVTGHNDFAMFWLRLPLSNDGQTVSHVLCHDISFPLKSCTKPYIPAQPFQDQNTAVAQSA